MTDLVHFAVCDFSGLARGRAFPAADLAASLQSGCGWVPANQLVTVFDTNAAEMDSLGDLRLMPDPATRTRLVLAEGRPGLDFYLCDTVTPDGAPWAACARGFLKSAVQALQEETGCTLRVGLEHEFSFVDPAQPSAPAFSLRRMGRHDSFIAALMASLERAGLLPEMVLPEFGPDQFEVTLTPAPPVTAADRAVVLREAVRLVAEAHGLRATLAPKVSPEVVGNGVHAHLSLVGRDGTPVMYQDGAPGSLSEPARAFCAGIVHDLPDFLALTAASPVSYLRLQPHAWSVAANCVGMQCREATLRVCPAPTPLHDPRTSHNVEFRATDATANPYVMLGGLIRAGLGGMREQRKLEHVFTEDLAALTPADFAARGLVKLPATLGEALDRMAAAPRVLAWAPTLFWDFYQAHKRAELLAVAELGDAELCLRYAAVY